MLLTTFPIMFEKHYYLSIKHTIYPILPLTLSSHQMAAMFFLS